MKFGQRIKEIGGINIVSNDKKIPPTIVIAEYHWIHPDFAAYYLKNIPVFWMFMLNTLMYVKISLLHTTIKVLKDYIHNM